MMTVVDEENKMAKYEHLYFVEFLDFICRVAIVGITMQDLLEYKVHLLLTMIYEPFYENQSMNTKDYPLREVDEQYKYD